MTKTFSPSHCLGENRDQSFQSQKRRYWNYISNIYPICTSYDLLDMFSDPFVMAFDVRITGLASTKVKSS